MECHQGHQEEVVMDHQGVDIEEVMGDLHQAQTVEGMAMANQEGVMVREGGMVREVAVIQARTEEG